MANQAFKDAMAVGKYQVKVFKQPEWENGKKVDGSHKSGDGQFGKWYLYDVKYGDKFYSLFGNEKNKDILDSGEACLNVWFAKGKKGVEVLHKDDIMAQEQNVRDSKGLGTKVPTRNEVEPPPIPMEAYTQGNEAQDDSTQNRIIFGMSGNQAAALLSDKDCPAGEMVKRWEQLRDMIYESNKKGPPPNINDF